MAMPAWMPEEWAKLSEDDQKSVSDFMLFLLARREAPRSDGQVKPLNYGVFKGKIRVPENFDDPLPEFSDYI